MNRKSNESKTTRVPKSKSKIETFRDVAGSKLNLIKGENPRHSVCKGVTDLAYGCKPKSSEEKIRFRQMVYKAEE